MLVTSDVSQSPNIEQCPPVGAFLESGIELRSLLAGVVTHFKVHFKLTVGISQQETITFTLKGFAGGPQVEGLAALVDNDGLNDITEFIGGTHIHRCVETNPSAGLFGARPRPVCPGRGLEGGQRYSF